MLCFASEKLGLGRGDGSNNIKGMAILRRSINPPAAAADQEMAGAVPCEPDLLLARQKRVKGLASQTQKVTRRRVRVVCRRIKLQTRTAENKTVPAIYHKLTMSTTSKPAW